MKKKRFTEEQIIAVLKEAEPELRRRSLSGGTGSASRRSTTGRRSTPVSEARRLKELEAENWKLKRLLADAELDKAVLKDLLGREWSARK